MIRSILMTGANAGIGRACALQLAKPGVHLTLACRSREKTEPVLAELRRRGATAEFLKLDLGDLKQAVAAGHAFAESHSSLDVLINNAGVGGVRGLTRDGYELNFGTNHLGHFAFTLPLVPLLESSRARIVMVASGKHYAAPGVPFDELRTKTRTISGIREYGVSKLCNILFAAEVRRRHPSISTVCVNPGRIATDIVRRVPWPVRPLIPFLFRLESADVGGKTLVNAMNALPAPSGMPPLYFHRLSSKEASSVARDPALASELWRFSLEATSSRGS